MRSTVPEVYNAIRSSSDVQAVPMISADWNMNRYFETKVYNIPDEAVEGNDIEMFPIESITEPNRPTKGINKARIGQGTVGGTYKDPITPRFYIVSTKDKYKYWQSPRLSNSVGIITGCQPTVLYGAFRKSDNFFTGAHVAVNKIVVKVENTWATPIEWAIQTTLDNQNWTTIATNPSIARDGSVTLYYNGTGWTSTKPADQSPMRTIMGLRLVVNRLGMGLRKDGNPTAYRLPANSFTYSTGDVWTTGANSYFSLIELSAHREVDLTPHLISTTSNFDVADVSQLYPIGTLTTNEGSMTLWNGQVDSQGNPSPLFNNENPNSPFAGLLDANVEITMKMRYKVGFNHDMQMFKLYTGLWAGQRTSEVTVDLNDYSTYFQVTTPNPAMYENLTMAEIVYRLCDSIGFVDYELVQHPDVTDFKIPVFYIDGEQTIWEIFDELAKATQSAIYFDQWNRLIIKPRNAAFDKNRPVNWTLRANKNAAAPTEAPDVIEFTQTEDYGANVIKVTYQTTDWTDWNNGVPTMQNVWAADDTLVLRASDLQDAMGAQDVVPGGANQFFRLPIGDVPTWPYQGLVNIEGEIIRFEGKRFIYHINRTDAAGNVMIPAADARVAIVKNEDEYKKYNELVDEGFRIKNHFDGNMRISVRGEWNTPVASHTIDARGWAGHAWLQGQWRSSAVGFTHNRYDSTVTLKANPNMQGMNDYFVATHGAPTDTPFYRYGMKFKFDQNAAMTNQAAGMVINTSGTRENGYFVELMPSEKITASLRTARNEVMVYARLGGQNYAANGRGAAFPIVQGLWYEVDIYERGNDLLVYVNGRLITVGTVPAPARQTRNGRLGLFIRGKSQATYEYVYATSQTMVDIPDDFGFFDKVSGGYVGGMFTREWVYQWKTATRIVKRKAVKYQQRYNQQFMDEFGPIVHEIREFDVKFDPAPVLHSRIFSTNDWSAACVEYRGDPFGAHFVMANVARQDAVLNGTETLRFTGGEGDVDQQFAVIGRALVLQEAEDVVIRHDRNYRARGEIEADLTSPWIQSKGAAQAVADWMMDHWGGMADGAAADIFGNPLIEVGDIVAVDFKAMNMDPVNYKYFVVGVQHSFDTGLTTSLSLRRLT